MNKKLSIKSLGVLAMLMAHPTRDTMDFLYANVPDTPSYVDNILLELENDGILTRNATDKTYTLSVPQHVLKLITDTSTESIYQKVNRLFKPSRTYDVIAWFMDKKIQRLTDDEHLSATVKAEFSAASIIQRYDDTKIAEAYEALFNSGRDSNFGMQTVLEYLNRASRG